MPLKISVVIPAYNASKTLDAAITSCLQQSYAPYEIIVVNDASSDNTTHIAQQYNEVTLITLEQNSGPSKARNVGWNGAKGDLVAFLDSDDVWHFDKLEVINKIFSEYTDIQLLGHSYAVKNTKYSVDSSAFLQRKSYLSILLRNPYQPSCMAIRTQLPLRFNESFRYCEDH